MKKILFSVIAVYTYSSFGCSVILPPFPEAVRLTEAIFISTVEAVEKTSSPKRDFFGSSYAAVVTVRVDKSYKGSEAGGSVLRIHTRVYPGPNSSCNADSRFGPGESWIIFGDWQDARKVFPALVVRGAAKVFKSNPFFNSRVDSERGRKEMSDLNKIFKN